LFLHRQTNEDFFSRSDGNMRQFVSPTLRFGKIFQGLHLPTASTFAAAGFDNANIRRVDARGVLLSRVFGLATFKLNRAAGTVYAPAASEDGKLVLSGLQPILIYGRKHTYVYYRLLQIYPTCTSMAGDG
jgi:hypothetical protein